MHFWTSFYGNQHAIVAHDVLPVGITRGLPRFHLEYRPLYCRLLAPNATNFGIDDRERFRPAFFEQLNGVGVTRIRARLQDISAANAGRPLVLLCFERLLQPHDWCHRQVFVEWWRAQGQDGYVGELPTGIDATTVRRGRREGEVWQPPLFS